MKKLKDEKQMRCIKEVKEDTADDEEMKSEERRVQKLYTFCSNP